MYNNIFDVPTDICYQLVVDEKFVYVTDIEYAIEILKTNKNILVYRKINNKWSLV